MSTLALIIGGAMLLAAKSAEGAAGGNGGGTSSPAAPAIVRNRNWIRFDAWFKAYGARYPLTGLPDVATWHVLKAIAIRESTLGTHPSVVAGTESGDGLSWGLMQLTLPTAGDMKGAAATVAELNDPETSISWAAKYLYTLSRTFPGDLRRIVLAYNAGPGNVKKGRWDSDYWDGSKTGKGFEQNFEIVKKYS